MTDQTTIPPSQSGTISTGLHDDDESLDRYSLSFDDDVKLRMHRTTRLKPRQRTATDRTSQQASTPTTIGSSPTVSASVITPTQQGTRVSPVTLPECLSVLTASWETNTDAARTTLRNFMDSGGSDQTSIDAIDAWMQQNATEGPLANDWRSLLWRHETEAYQRSKEVSHKDVATQTPTGDGLGE